MRTPESKDIDAQSQNRYSVFKGIMGRVFGYDFFISYCQADGGEYAETLARMLEERGFEVFLDRDDYAAGHDWKRIGEWTLQRTSKLVLVGTVGALRSSPVEHEIEVFSHTGRHIIPLNVDGSLGDESIDSPIHKHLGPATIRVEHNEAVEDGLPTVTAIDRICHSFTILRQEERRTRIFAYIAFALALLAIVAVFFAVRSNINANTAETNKARAEENARRANYRLGISEFQRAVTARDVDGETIRAALLFTSSAIAFSAADEPQRVANALLAIDDNVVATFPHNDEVLDSRLGSEALLTWSKDGTLRLWDLEQMALAKTFNHEGLIMGALFSTNESHILSWSSNGTVCLWDSFRALRLQTFEHRDFVNGAMFNEDENRILTWSDDGTAALWNRKQAERIGTFQHSRDGAVLGALISQDDSRVLTWGDDGVERLWDVGSDKLLRVFTPDDENGRRSILRRRGEQSRVSFSADRSLVLVSNYFAVPRLLETTNFEVIKTFSHDSGTILGAVMNHDATRVLSWDSEGCIILWDPTKEMPIKTFQHENEWLVGGASFTDDASRILSWSENATLLWDVRNERPLKRIEQASYTSGASFNSETDRILTWSGSGTASLWAVGNDSPLKTFKHVDGLNGAEFVAGHVLTWSDDGTARLWNPAANEPIKRFKHDGWVHGVMLDQDRSHLLTWNKTAWLRDLTSDHVVQKFEHPSPLRTAEFNTGSSILLTWCADGVARVWDTTKEKPIQVFKHESNSPPRLSRDGSEVIVVNNGKAIVRDTLGGQEKFEFVSNNGVRGALWFGDEAVVLVWTEDGTAHLWRPGGTSSSNATDFDEEVLGALYNNDRSQVVTWNSDAELQLWNAKKRLPVSSFTPWLSDQPDAIPFLKEKHLVMSRPAWFRHDGSQVLTHDKKAALLWDHTHDEPTREFRHGEAVNDALFSRDGSKVLTCSDDGTAVLWDTEHGQRIRTFRHAGDVRGAVFSRNETEVLTWSRDETACIWGIPVFEDLTRDVLNAIKHDLEVRTAATISEQGTYTLLNVEQWMKRRKKWLLMSK